VIARLRAVRREETGSTLILTMFYCFLGLMVILVVAAATSLYIERKRLFTLADGAALAGAEGFSLNDVTVDGDRLIVRLSSADVRTAVGAYLADAGSGRFDDLEVVEATSPDGTSATVTLRSVWRAPVATDLLPVAIPIEVTATARSVLD
jgi:hypothetical protein